MNRIDPLETFRIQPSQKISIQYGRKSYEGVAGDTIAGLLYGNGIRVFSRSLKYHRPRGLYSLDGECSNTMMRVDGMPNVRTENTPARNGMKVTAQNVAGKTADTDPMAFMDKLGFAMPAGFYYRTLHKPAKMWPVAIKKIRKAAGLGVMDPDFRIEGYFDEIYPTADVCVVGGGPAGMTAALAAAAPGLRVILMENRPWLGGVFDYRPAAYEGDLPLYQRAAHLARKIEETPNIRVFTHTAVVGNYNDNLVTAFQRGNETDPFDERYIEIRARSIVVATGCIERPLLFENNDRPGVMQVGCAHRLARTWGLLPGRQAVFSIGDDLGLEAAADLSDLGLEIACVADTRMDGQDETLIDALSRRNIPVYRGWIAYKAHGAKQVKKVTIGPLAGVQRQDIECDLLVASAGLTPLTGLLSTRQVELLFDRHTGFFLPAGLPDGIHTAGRMLGFQDSVKIEISGQLAGMEAAADCGFNAPGEIDSIKVRINAFPGPALGSKIVSAPVKGKKTFICFDEDTTLKNIDQAMADGFDVPELIKRYTSAGTGPGQGGIPGHNLPLYVAQTQQSPDQAPRSTTVRAPLIPTLMATYAGTQHDMCKRTALHDSQVASGGKMERVGVWTRARRFAEDTKALAEIKNVRHNVGMLDASTLGKFRIHGPDALKALQRVYVSDMDKIVDGRVKYSAMCNEDGCIIDDGVVLKQGENDYYFTTSTGRAGQTVEWIRYHTRYDHWDFNIVNLTDACGVINLAGPNARKVLEKVTTADVSNEAFPFVGWRDLTLADCIPARTMRLGFVGELSYEFHVPASYTQTLWNILEAAGKELGIQNFGLEAQNGLRLEKGHLIIGSESEQRTTLHDVGLGFLWDRKPDANTVGAVALTQTEHQKDRLKLVGIKMADASAAAPKDGSAIVDTKFQGYICTARFSEALNEPIGMALVKDALAEPGTELNIYEDSCNGQLLKAIVAKMPFYDSDGSRMKM
ncbi:MAG: glycine cleavage T protein (aminomethyl transferase) [Deltaproteobacteria bacterium]|nr:MAG: glycine cleavage T protein (aminomethyl transferase) [Deltaproteobacteria bacterium]